jgi:glycine C-acetyltransferase
MEHLESLLRRAQGEYGTVLVVADSVFSMDGDIMDLPTTKALCERYDARLMVDEAHSIGALGATGHGVEEHFDMNGSIDLKMGTLSKSIPSVGGYCAGSADLIDYLRHYSRPFIFSAALPPAQTAAALEAFNVIEDEPGRVRDLHDVTRRYTDGLKAQGWDTMLAATCVVPTLVGDETKTMDLTRMLFDRGVFVCPIVHPAVPRGTERLRTCVMATHSEDDIAHVLGAFEEAGRELGLIAR